MEKRVISVENGIETVEITSDSGKKHIVKQPIRNTVVKKTKITTAELLAEETLLETKYQTVLLEMMML